VAAFPTPYLSPEQYLELDRQSERRSEYYDGHIYPMQDTSFRHGLILTNLMGSLIPLLASSTCRMVTQTGRVQVPGDKKYVYPDLIVVCGKMEFQDGQRDTLLNPTVLFEVLSPSTADYDRGIKFEWYRSIPGLQAYVVVAHNRVAVTRYTRQTGQRWLLDDFSNIDDTLELDSINVRIPLTAIYHDIELDEQ